MSEELRKYWVRETLKRSAHEAVVQATKRGFMPVAAMMSCEDCRAPAEHWHHDDYRKPLDVVSLCRECHAKRPRALPESPRRFELRGAELDHVGVPIILPRPEHDRLAIRGQAIGGKTVVDLVQQAAIESARSVPILGISSEQVEALDAVAEDFDEWVQKTPASRPLGATPRRLTGRPSAARRVRGGRMLACGHYSHGHIPTDECRQTLQRARA